VRIDVLPDELEQEQLAQSQDDKEHSSAGYRGVLMWAMDAQMKPCLCAGTVRHNALRRCFCCSMPVISDDPHGGDLSPDEAACEREHDHEGLERVQGWQAAFLSYLKNQGNVHLTQNCESMWPWMCSLAVTLFCSPNHLSFLSANCGMWVKPVYQRMFVQATGNMALLRSPQVETRVSGRQFH
jgi:hypothetical protein